MNDPTLLNEWRALDAHQNLLTDLHLRELFGADPTRASRYTVNVGDLTVDYSKHLVTADTMPLLMALAEAREVPSRVEAMLRGDIANSTEQRSVLHTALRAPRNTTISVDGHNVVPDVHDVLDRAGAFAERVRSGDWVGFTGKAVRRVVNIGIGGSDLGPAMAYEALRPYRHDTIECRFVSNIDGGGLASALDGADPETTLFIVASKTFGTVETLTNARSAQRWLIHALGDESATSKHFVAVSTNSERVAAFGIDTQNMYGFWDWVGGRYSMDSAIGLSLMIAIGSDGFTEMLDGFRQVDDHFRDAPLSENVPVILAMLSVWYRNFWKYPTHAVLPYSRDLHRFAAYLQQLSMESNGKQVRTDGEPVTTETGAIVWGEPGTNGQHAFYQLLHQGTTVVPADFIAFCTSPDTFIAEQGDHHDLLMANCFAQTEALAFGRTSQDVAATGVDADLVAHRTFPGNRPSTTILAPALTPSVLGQLVAMYEHKTMVEGVIWGINSYDQWGVELGKVLANNITPELVAESDTALAHDSSTNALIRHYRSARGR